MAEVLPRDVSAHDRDVTMGNRACKIAARPCEPMRGRCVHAASRLRLCIPDEGHQRQVRSETDQHVDVLGHDCLREDVNRVPSGGLEESPRDGGNVGPPDTMRAPTRMPGDMRKQREAPVASLAHTQPFG